MCANDLGEALRIEAEEIGVAVEIIRHADDIGANRLLMLVEIGFSDSERTGDSVMDGLAEPGLHAEVKEKIGKERDEDRRNHRNQAEQHDEARVEARAGKAAAALGPKLHQPPRQDGDKRQQQDEIEKQEELIEMRHAGAGPDAAQFGERREP